MKNLSKKFFYIIASTVIFVNMSATTFFADGVIETLLGGVTSLVTSVTDGGTADQVAPKSNPFDEVKVTATTDIKDVPEAAKNAEVSDPKIATKIYGENLIPIISAEVTPEVMINEGPDAGKIFLKTATLKCVFKNPISIDFPEAADFFLKVTFKYDKKSFVVVEGHDNVTCEYRTHEDMRYKIVGNSEILPALPGQNPQIATVSSIYTVYGDNGNGGHKTVKECAHADLFCSVNGDIGYNAQQF